MQDSPQKYYYCSGDVVCTSLKEEARTLALVHWMLGLECHLEPSSRRLSLLAKLDSMWLVQSLLTD